MLMGQITYWFRATDDHRESGIEWLRQTGCAIAAAASAVFWDDGDFQQHPWVEVSVGSVNRHPRLRRHVTVEAVSFRATHPATLDRVEEVLRQLGTSRGLTVIREDPVVEGALAPFAFLYRRSLVPFGWWGAANERHLQSFTGLRALCPRNDEDVHRLRTAFGSADAAKVLPIFVGDS